MKPITFKEVVDLHVKLGRLVDKLGVLLDKGPDAQESLKKQMASLGLELIDTPPRKRRK